MSAVVEAIRAVTPIASEELPQPKGPYILLRMRKVSNKASKNSLIEMPESRVADETMANPMADVILMGPDCFRDPVFYGERRCEVGDTILMAPYSGQRVIIGAHSEADEYRIIPDYVVVAVCPNPDLVRRGL